MSASEKKHDRSSVGDSARSRKLLAKQEEEKKKRSQRRKVQIYSVLFVLLVAFVVVVNSNVLYRTLPAVSIGDTSYTPAEFNYFYNAAYNNLVNMYGKEMMLNMGLDTTKPLKGQAYSDPESEYEDWADYFEDIALNNMKSVTMLTKKAAEENYSLTDEDKQELESAITSLETAAKDNGWTNVDRFIAAVYGRGNNLKTAKKLLEQSILASSYATYKQESFTYTDDELSAYYDEHKNEYDFFQYYLYNVVAETDTTEYEEGQEPSEEEAEAKKAEFMAVAKQEAEAIATDVTDAESFLSAVRESLPEASQAMYADDSAIKKTVKGSSLDSAYAEWLQDDARQEGDVTTVETGTGYAVLYYIGRDNNDYATKNVRHVLIKVEEPEELIASTPSDLEADTDEAKETAADIAAKLEEAKQVAKNKAQEILDTWKAGDATEDSFAALAKESSEDEGSKQNGGLYEKIYQGQMVPEFDAFCFDPNRKPGDTAIVYGESSSYKGYHVMYFVGDGPLYRTYLAENAKRTEDYTTWEEQALENYVVTRESMMRLTK